MSLENSRHSLILVIAYNPLIAYQSVHPNGHGDTNILANTDTI